MSSGRLQTGEYWRSSEVSEEVDQVVVAAALRDEERSKFTCWSPRQLVDSVRASQIPAHAHRNTWS